MPSASSNAGSTAMPRVSTRGAAPPRKAPQRTCIACRTTGDKRGLVRIVRTPDGVVVDPTGKQAGRGAYLCGRPECWREAMKRNRLDAALKTRLSQDEKLRLAEYAAGLTTVTA